MGFSVQELLQLPSMKKAQLIAGAEEIRSEITNIMVMEAPDVSSWLQTGHMLLSSLYPMQYSSDKDLENLICQIKQLKGAGLIIKTERFISEIPSVLISACEQWKLPLIQIPGEVLYNDIQIEAMQALFNEKATLLHYHHKLHMQFTEYALKQPSFEQVIRKLSELVENPILLMNHQKNILCSTDNRMKQLKFVHNIPLLVKEMNFNYQKQLVLLEETNQVATQIIVEIPNIGNDTYYLALAAFDHEICRLDFIALENATSFLQMRLIQDFAVSQVMQNYLNDLFDDLLNGKFATSEQKLEAIRTLNLSLSIQYRIVVVRLHFSSQEYENQTQYKKNMQLFVNYFQRNWKQSFCRIRSDRIIFLLPAEEHSHIPYKQRVKNSIEEALKLFPIDKILYHAAIGDACNVTQISDYGEQPLRMLQYSNSNVKESIVLDNSDFGVFHFFIDMEDSGKLLELIPQPLRKLHKRSPVLSHTLQVFLDNQQQLKTSADQLYIHPKTMRYRIDRIKEITSIEYDNADELLKYNIGFRVLRLVSDEML